MTSSRVFRGVKWPFTLTLLYTIWREELVPWQWCEGLIVNTFGRAFRQGGNGFRVNKSCMDNVFMLTEIRLREKHMNTLAVQKA